MKISIEGFNAAVIRLPDEARHMAWDGNAPGFVGVVRRSLPEFALQLMECRSSQEPVVILTMDAPGIFASMGNAFQSHVADADMVIRVDEDIGNFGGALVDHLHKCWTDEVDSSGRPIEWDADYQPRPLVFSFLSTSIEHAYLLALTSVAEMAGDTWESLSELRVMLANFSASELQSLKDSHPNEGAKDKHTPILFLHMQCADGLVFCKSLPIREFLEQAQEFRMDAFPVALSSYPVARWWPFCTHFDVVAPRSYACKPDFDELRARVGAC